MNCPKMLNNTLDESKRVYDLMPNGFILQERTTCENPACYAGCIKEREAAKPLNG